MIQIDQNLSIQNFAENHLNQVFQLSVLTYGEKQSTPHATLNLISKLSFGEKGYYFGVIELNKIFIGFLCFYEESSDVLILGDLVISKEYREKKLSHIVIQSLLNEILKIKSYKTLKLTVRRNNIPAIKCYVKLNFKTVEILDKYYFDNEDALKMELSLIQNNSRAQDHFHEK